MDRDEERDYEWVYRAGFASVARTVFLIVGSRAVAEEITQDAFLKLLQKWSTVSDYERPEAWARKVAVRMAVRHVGRERSRPLRELRAQPLPDRAAAARPGGGPRGGRACADAARSGRALLLGGPPGARDRPDAAGVGVDREAAPSPGPSTTWPVLREEVTGDVR